MIFRKIKITGQKTLHVSIPESWDDVTFKQFRDIHKEEDSLKRVSILTDIPYELFNKYPELADFYVWLESKLSWASEWDETNTDCEVFILEDETFNFPKDVGMMSIGLYKDMQNEAQENKDNIIDIFPLICASYYQLIKDGEYNYVKANELVNLFDNQPCVKVYNAAGFFLNKVNVLRNGTKKGLKSRVIQTIKSLLGSIGFRKYSGLKLYPHN